MRRILIGVAVALVTGLAWGAPSPEAVARKEAGNAYLKHHEFAKARDAYLAALQVDPWFADAHYNLGVVYFFRLDDPARALYHFTRYARLHPDAPDLAQVQALTVQALEKIEDRERQAYGRALEKGTAAEIRVFIDSHPDSPYVPDARSKVLRLEAYDKAREDHSRAVRKAYETALARRTPEALGDFLSRYPDAPQAGEAGRLKREWVDARLAETTDYDAAVAAGTRDALEKFVAGRPHGAHTADARAGIERLRGADQGFAIAAETGSVRGMERYLATYPDSPRAADARHLIDKWKTEQNEEARRIEAVRARAGETSSAVTVVDGESAPSAAPADPANEPSSTTPGTAQPLNDPVEKVSGSRKKALTRYRSMIKGK